MSFSLGRVVVVEGDGDSLYCHEGSGRSVVIERGDSWIVRHRRPGERRVGGHRVRDQKDGHSNSFLGLCREEYGDKKGISDGARGPREE